MGKALLNDGVCGGANKNQTTYGVHIPNQRRHDEMASPDN